MSGRAYAGPHVAQVIAGTPARVMSGFDQVTYAASDYFSTRRTSTGAQGNWCEWEVLLDPGTYTLRMFQRLAADNGILTVSVDGVDVGTVDGYAAAGATGAPVDVQGIFLDRPGLHLIRLRLDTKNPASAGYFGRINGFLIAEASHFLAP